jgi:DNA-binding transcriptional LysR family regulator
MSSAEQIDLLRNRALDIGFMRYPAPNEFASRLIGRDRLVLALPKAYAAQWRGKTLEALAQTPFVQLERRRSIPLFDQVTSLCNAYHFTPKIEQEATEFSTVLALVASGAGVSMVPRTARQEIKGVVYREMTHGAAEWEFGAVWRKGEPNPVIENFMSCLDAELTPSGGIKA